MLQRPSLLLPEEDDEEEGEGFVSTWDPPPETWQAQHPRRGVFGVWTGVQYPSTS